MDIQIEKLTIQEVAETTGLSTHTLRYYERNGLIHPIGRMELGPLTVEQMKEIDSLLGR